jgi:hypothetical protein
MCNAIACINPSTSIFDHLENLILQMINRLMRFASATLRHS